MAEPTSLGEPAPAGRVPADDAAAPVEIGPPRPWQPTGVAVDPWLVLRLARYRRPDAVPELVQAATRAMAARAEALAEPRAVLRALRVAAADPAGVRLQDGPRLGGPAVGRLLAGCPVAVAFALTLGPRLEAEVAARAERGEVLEAYLLDTAGWAALETAVRALRRDLAARARPAGWQVTHRLAPGYRDWPLGEQRALLDLLGDLQGLLRLSEHGVLVPFKSLTGLFGLRPGGQA